MILLRWRLGVLPGLLLVLALGALAAEAGSFTVYPTQVHLSSRAPSSLVTLGNQGDEAARFQLSVVSWEQSARGEPHFTPTRDLVFFPPLLSLAPKAERKIRVGKITPCGASEKTYRLFIEELPPLRSPGRPDTGTHVRTLTRFGIPVFLEPTKPAAKRNVELTDIRPGHFSVAVRNPGNVHLHLHRVRIKGLGAAGVSVFERELASSYVLAGGTRLYEVDVPPAECPRVERLEVDVTTDGDTFAERFEAPAGVCGR